MANRELLDLLLGGFNPRTVLSEAKAAPKVKTSRTDTLEFDTPKLLKMFGLPSPDDYAGDFDFWPTPEDVDQTIREQGLLEDEEAEPSDDLRQAVGQLMSDAMQSGTQDRYAKEVLATLERTLETFQNFKMDRESPAWAGITGIEVSWDKTTITFDEDLIQIMNMLERGYGMTEPDVDSPSDISEYVKSHIGLLRHYWEIFGDRQPEPDFDRIEDFDAPMFRDGIKQIETTGTYP